jgi:hypothetical protein
MNKPAFIFTVWFAAIAYTPAVAQVDDESSRKTLAKMTAVSLLVEEIGEEAQRDGLSDRDIQSDVERALRKAGIGVLSEDESTRDTPMFYVAVLTDKNSDGVYGFAVFVRVLQRVRLARDTSVAVFATTWEALPTVGTVGARYVDRLRAEVLDSTSEFINAYRAANPN